MLTIHLDSPVSLTEQILQGLRRRLADGTLRPGDELPTVRQLALDLGINLNTVARAYRLLEDDGLVSTVRGRGTVVTASRETRRGTPAEARARVTDRLRDALADARLAGLDQTAAERLVADVMGEFWGADADGGHKDRVKG
jgi:GntR family transcriptional regulator